MGGLQSEGNYKNGQKEGKWTEYYEGGKPSEQGSYIKNVKSGMWDFWDKYGVKIKEQEMINGKPDGKWIEYHQNGQKSGEGTFINRVKEGKWTYWDVKGNIVYQVEYKGGAVMKVIKNSREEIKPQK